MTIYCPCFRKGIRMSLADKLAALTNPDPGFEDPEKDTDVTAAKVW